MFLTFEFDILMKCFVALFVIMDPFSSIPTFLLLTKKQSEADRAISAFIATAVAGAVLLIFTLIGPFFLGIMGISIAAFKVAGGILLLVTALQYFLSIEFENPKRRRTLNVAVVIVGVPMLTGPGVMTTAILLVSQFGLPVALTASLAVILLTYAVLRLSTRLFGILGEHGLEIFSKLMAIFLAAIAVEFMKNGVLQFLMEAGVI